MNANQLRREEIRSQRKTHRSRADIPGTLFVLLLLFLMSFGCGPRPAERKLEDGFEVVTNRLEPDRIDGQPGSLSLQEVLVLDTEAPEVAAAGLVDIQAVLVDSEDGIYLLSRQGENHFFFKFTSGGQFVKSFGSKGRGPGEMEYPLLPRMLSGNHLAVTDVSKKLVVFDTEGNVVSETRIEPSFVIVNPLENGHSVVFRKSGAENPEDEHFLEKVSLFSPENQEIQELDVLRVSRKTVFLDPVLSWWIIRDRMYFINEQRGYEILVYDGEGAPVRKIRKPFHPARLRPALREALLRGIPQESPLRDPTVVPEFLPPIHTVFSDESGRIFAVTFEKGEQRGEFQCDIFNPQGLFISRISLPVLFEQEPFPIHAVIKNRHLYCVGEKETGYHQLRVFRMTWN